jgi:hypothetical protein
MRHTMQLPDPQHNISSKMRERNYQVLVEELDLTCRKTGSYAVRERELRNSRVSKWHRSKY